MNLHTIEKRFLDKSALICIVGLGYVGLPLALTLADAGFRVIGIDINEERVNQINLGMISVEGFDEMRVNRLIDTGKMYAVNSHSSISKADAVIICVPTPLDDKQDPDLSFVINATQNVAKFAHENMLVVLQSTVYPGTTREILVPIFEHQNFEIGKNLYICFSPERVDPGRTDWTTVNTPKVIGGITPECLKIGKALYSSALECIVPVSSTEMAEMTKILENSYRAINIAFINEIMVLSDEFNLNVWELIDAASTKPFGFSKFLPGPGVGGHCIPVDPLYLTWKLKQKGKDCEFISLAHKVNSNMPQYWVSKAEETIKNLRKPCKEVQVLILGVTYKKDCADYRESPSLDIIRILVEKDFCVKYYDPHVPCITIKNTEMHSIENLNYALNTSDCVIIATDHTDFFQIDFERLECPVINCRGRKIIKKTTNSDILETVGVGSHEEI